MPDVSLLLYYCETGTEMLDYLIAKCLIYAEKRVNFYAVIALKQFRTRNDFIFTFKNLKTARITVK